MVLMVTVKRWMVKLIITPARLAKRVKSKKYLLPLSVVVLFVLLTTSRQRELTRSIKSFTLPSLNEKQIVSEEELVEPNKGFFKAETKRLKNENNRIKYCSKIKPKLIGEMHINPNITPSFDEVEKMAGPTLSNGGCFSSCKPIQKVAVIIPFKDRDSHLKTLLFYLHPMLMRQNLYYCVYVAEQFDNGQFNKAMVMNAAFEAVMKIDDYDCIVFHDVDMIPENDTNIYKCGPEPRHLSPAIDKFNYKPHYGTDFGGVTAITPWQYRRANGHSNEFWGWGGEDNDMEFRIRYNGMKIIPSSLEAGRYKMIIHKHPWKFTTGKFSKTLNNTVKARAKVDGLSDLQYRMMGIEKQSTYTKLHLDIRRVAVKEITLFIDGIPVKNFEVEEGECRWEKYEGKYTDFSIELSGYKEAAHLASLSINQRKLPPDGMPGDIKAAIPTGPVKFSLVNNFTEALRLCDKLYPECLGVLKESSEEKYSLRRGAIPRNFVVSAPAQPRILRKKNKIDGDAPMRYYFPKKTCYMKYCPGVSGYIQPYFNPLPVDLDDNSPKPQHTYKFEIHFSVLLEPTKYLYYADEKYFEAQLLNKEELFAVKWPDGNLPDFKLDQTPREYTFTTTDLPLPNVPGCYAVVSKLLDMKQHPYYQWHWWVELKSRDSEADAKNRETFWKKKLRENSAKAHLEKHAKDVEQKRLEQKKREKSFERGIAKLIAGKSIDDENKEEEEETRTLEEPDHFYSTIEVYDVSKGIAKAVNVIPNPVMKVHLPNPEQHKAFHAGLPKHLKGQT